MARKEWYRWTILQAVEGRNKVCLSARIGEKRLIAYHYAGKKKGQQSVHQLVAGEGEGR